MNSLSRRSFLGSTAAGVAATAGAASAVAASPASNADDDSQIGKTPHTKFAINVEMWFRDLPPLDKSMARLDAVAELGFPGFEFWPWRGRDLAAMRKKCDELKLTPVQFSAWGFSPGMNDPANRDRIVPEITAACEAAGPLGVKLLCVVAGNDIKGKSKQEMHAVVIEHLKMAADVAEKHNVTLMLEAMNGRVDHKGHCLYFTEDSAAIIKSVGSPRVKIMHDLYHRQLQEGDLHGHVSDHFKDIVYYQLADHPGRNQPGTGEINYAAVLRHIYNLGYRGWVGAECVPKGDVVEAARMLAAADHWA